MSKSFSICVFGGSRLGSDPAFTAGAIELGKLIADRGHTLVFGAGRSGMMGVVADAALEHNGRVVGIIPDFLAYDEVLHPHLSDTIIVDDLFTRKAKMFELSDAYVALPGGLGTFDELLEVITWIQLKRIQAPVGLLNSANYYAPFLDLLKHSVTAGFADQISIDQIICNDEALNLLDQLERAAQPASER